MATDEVAYILALKQIEILYIEDDRILSLAIPWDPWCWYIC